MSGAVFFLVQESQTHFSFGSLEKIIKDKICTFANKQVTAVFRLNKKILIHNIHVIKKHLTKDFARVQPLGERERERGIKAAREKGKKKEKRLVLLRIYKDTKKTSATSISFPPAWFLVVKNIKTLSFQSRLRERDGITDILFAPASTTGCAGRKQ